MRFHAVKFQWSYGPDQSRARFAAVGFGTAPKTESAQSDRQWSKGTATRRRDRLPYDENYGAGSVKIFMIKDETD